MKLTRATKNMLILLPLMIIGLLSFQNCSPAKFSTSATAVGAPKGMGEMGPEDLQVPVDEPNNVDIALPDDSQPAVTPPAVTPPADTPPASSHADNDEDHKHSDGDCAGGRAPASHTESGNDDKHDDSRSSDSHPGAMATEDSRQDDSKEEPKKERAPDQASSSAQVRCHTIAKSEAKVVGNTTEVACGDSSSSSKKCALVCHVPPGNPSAKHNIVVGLSARLHAHKPGAHGGDYDGPCSDEQQTIEVCAE